MEEKTGSTPPRHPPNPMLVSKFDTFHLRIKSGKVALLLTRWLLTKFYRSGRKYSEEERSTCFLLDEFWNSYRNKGFYRKNEERYLNLLHLMRLSLKPGELENFEKRKEEILLQSNHLLNPRAFLSLPSFFVRRFLFRKNRRMKKLIIESRRIGVGYRDKGASRDTSKDGSPRWEDVYGAIPDQELELETELWWEVTEFLIPESSRSSWKFS